MEIEIWESSSSVGMGEIFPRRSWGRKKEEHNNKGWGNITFKIEQRKNCLGK